MCYVLANMKPWLALIEHCSRLVLFYNYHSISKSNEDKSKCWRYRGKPETDTCVVLVEKFKVLITLARI